MGRGGYKACNGSVIERERDEERAIRLIARGGSRIYASIGSSIYTYTQAGAYKYIYRGSSPRCGLRARLCCWGECNTGIL